MSLNGFQTTIYSSPGGFVTLDLKAMHQIATTYANSAGAASLTLVVPVRMGQDERFSFKPLILRAAVSA